MTKKTEELELIFKVPETDFDAIELQLGLKWAIEQQTKDAWNEGGAKHAVKILQLINDQYMDKLGRPQWKLPRPTSLSGVEVH
jgi:hypothetical protein